MEGFTKLANLLLEREVIFSDDLENIFGPRAKKEEELLLEKENDTKEEIEVKENE
jgi:cell division protease FtsH